MAACRTDVSISPSIFFKGSPETHGSRAANGFFPIEEPCVLYNGVNVSYTYLRKERLFRSLYLIFSRRQDYE